MDFEFALKLLRAFPACNPRIFKQFAGFPNSGSSEAENGYVLFVDASLVGKDCCFEFKDFVKSHDLNMKHFGEYLMVSDS